MEGNAAPSAESVSPSITAVPTALPTVRPTATPRVFPTATPLPTPAVESTRIRWQGRLWYLHGANLPWVNWGCDFGCGTEGGVSSPEVSKTAASALAGAKPAGLNVIRWWMFPGEPSQFILAADGSPTGLKPAVYQDIDAALRLAQQYDVYFTFVLFSAPSHVPAAWIGDKSQRNALVGVIGDLAAHYATNPHILAWDVFNEPEWEVMNPAAGEDLVATVDAVADEIHRRSPALVTIGSVNITALGMWLNSPLDFYEPHWYDPMEPKACAICTDYATLSVIYGLKKPIVIGEFYADANVDAAGRYADLYKKGYAGAWGWSLLPGGTQDKLAVDLAAARQFADSVPDAGPRGR
ncbi:MAG: cellulase family glycosylhydrolase [Dehalococcoidia bacterium]